MPQPSTASELIAALASAFDRAQIAYVVIGGQAVLRYGRPRLTDDVDFNVLVPCHHPSQVLDICRRLQIDPEVEDVEQLIYRVGLFPGKHAASAMDVDIAFGDSAYEKLLIERAETEVIHGVSVRFASREDLVIQKTLASRDVDLGDILWILQYQKNIDLAYIHHWLEQFEQIYERPLVEEFESLHRKARRT